MTFAFVATNEHGRALLELIRSIRACATCVPSLYITCREHCEALTAMYPDPCPDPECPACRPVHDNGDYRV